MSTSALARYSTVREALVEGRGLLDLRDQRRRDRLARLVVQRERVQHLGRRQPVLEQLRRELDVVARHARAGRASGRSRSSSGRAARGRTRGTACVASSQLISTGSPGLPFTKLELLETIVVTSPLEPLLVAVGVHPRAGALARPRVRDRSTRGRRACRSPCPSPPRRARPGGRPGTSVDRREREAEQLAGHPEHALAQLLELQVRLHLVLVEVVLRLADLLRVVAVVPGRDLAASRPPCRRSPACRRPPRGRARPPASRPPPSAPWRARASSPSRSRAASGRGSGSRAASRARRAASGSR